MSQLIERIPFNVPLDIFVRGNIAKYGDDNELKEMVVNSIPYNIEKVIGEGSFGKCFKLTSSNAELACKMIQKSSLVVEIARNEVNIHKILKHQNIVNFISSVENEQH